MAACLTYQYLRLLFGSAIPPHQFARLLAGHHNLAALLQCRQHGPEVAAALSAPSTRGERAVEQALRWREHSSHSLLIFEEAAFPERLRELPVPPPLLFVSGEVGMLNGCCLAIVGSRRATSYSRRVARLLAHELTEQGLTVTSGLARGIDTAAHEGALAAGGKTIAVIGTGIDRTYPATNRELQAEIAEKGALVSEFPLGTPPLKENFPRRNRLISGLSLGTLVVEASLESGSLITARLAMEQGREVFAVPGPILGPSHRGCHSLLRNGAKLVEETNDVVEEFESVLGPRPAISRPASQDLTARSSQALPEHCRAVVRLIAETDCHFDSLLGLTRLTAAELAATLQELECMGLIERSGGRYELRERAD